MTSLAVANSTDLSIIAFAGINSSEQDQKAGRNQHLRCFKLHHPAKRADSAETSKHEDNAAASASHGETEALGKTSLFTPSNAVKPETYQRVLRLLKTSETDAYIGAIATGLAPQGEVVLFDTSKIPPALGDVVQRINLGDGKEAADIDLISAEEGQYRLGYCTDYDVYLTKSENPRPKQTREPEFVYGIPHPDTFASPKSRPKFRSLRFLTPKLILLVQNKPNRQGAEILLLELPKHASLGLIVLRKKLPKSIQVATALSTALLPASSSSDSVQHVIAIAGQDNSITIFTIDPPSSPPYDSLKFSLHTTLLSVHPLQITSLTFSTYNTGDQTSQPPRPLKLASTSIAKTVVVHTLPLTLSPSSSKDPASQRYVLQPPQRSEAAQLTFSLIVSALVIALGAFLLQAFTEIRGSTPEYLGAKGWLSERVRNYIARPYMFDDLHTSIPDTSIPVAHIPTQPVQAAVSSAVSSAIEATKEKVSLRHILSQRKSRQPGDKGDIDPEASPTDLIVVTPYGDGNSLSVEVRDPATLVKDELQVKKWEEMEEAEREGWKLKLSEAGEWAIEEGEAILKGVMFSGLGGFIGERVAEILGT